MLEPGANSPQDQGCRSHNATMGSCFSSDWLSLPSDQDATPVPSLILRVLVPHSSRYSFEILPFIQA